jgi:hypothetical protein
MSITMPRSKGPGTFTYHMRLTDALRRRIDKLVDDKEHSIWENTKDFIIDAIKEKIEREEARRDGRLFTLPAERPQEPRQEPRRLRT